MGLESKIKKSAPPPLPAPTETDSHVTTASDLPTDLATDVSRPGDEKSVAYSLPEDGTPVTIKTRGHKSNRSQTSLLIEYFEGSKSSNGSKEIVGDRKPSVRVRVTPSKHRKSDHVQITETKSSRKVSGSSRKSHSGSPAMVREGEKTSTLSAAGDADDGKSLSSYASATEESNVSHRPIDIDIDRSGNVHRRRRPASPLIPAADSAKAAFPPPDMSDISAIPTDSFLDGSGSPTKHVESRRRSESPHRVGDALAGAAAGLGAAALVDKVRKSSGGEKERERVSVSKSKDRERRHRTSRSRTSSVDEKETRSPRRRSSRGHEHSTVSAADSSVLSSQLSSHRGADTHSVRSGASKTSINNPKLLETVEDAIRRLILPELNALKREQSRHKDHRGSVTSSGTSVSRDEYTSDRRRSSGNARRVDSPRDEVKIKERRDREARHDLEASPPHSENHEMVDEIHHDREQNPRRSGGLKAAAAGAGVGALAAAALIGGKNVEDKRQRRRRLRADQRSRVSDDVSEEGYDEEVAHHQPVAPMPLMSEINPSELTRSSILSADTDRPQSASEEQIHEYEEVTPTKESTALQALGAKHANVSHGDLRALPRQQYDEEVYDQENIKPYDREIPHNQQQVYEEDVYDEGDPEGQRYAHEGYDMYDVPAPLNYVPYAPERRALSPIPSVSGYTEGGSERPNQRDSRVSQTTRGSFSSPEKSPYQRTDGVMDSPGSVPSNMRSREFDDDRSLRSSGLDQRNTMYTEDSDGTGMVAGQAIQAVGATNPKFVHPLGVESAVASLVDGSMLDESVVGGHSYEASPQHEYHDERNIIHEERSRTPTQGSVNSQTHEVLSEERSHTPVSGSQRSQQFVEEYEPDEYGNKVPRESQFRRSPTAAEAAITGAAVGAAAAAIKAANDRRKQATVEHTTDEEFVAPPGAGVVRNKSFKERTMNGEGPANTPTHSVDRFVEEYDQPPKLGATGMPDLSDPMPEVGYYGHDDGLTEPSIVEDRLDGTHHAHNPAVEEEHWKEGMRTPTQERVERFAQHQGIPREETSGHGHGLGITEAAGAAAIATAAALAHSHSRQPSQEQEDEWHRTSADRKRDTLITNPYEGASPIANLTGLNVEGLREGGYGAAPVYRGDYGIRSPLGAKIDEGYISQGPNKTPDIRDGKGNGLDLGLQPGLAGVEDPFYAPKHTRHLSGLSQGMQSPFYDGATGTGIDRIESKDIIALMQHLMVRDAQRSARDTEILVTLVKSATEMRNSFDEVKKLIIDAEDTIITETRDNTERTIRNTIGGPRPFPGSAQRSIVGSGTMEDLGQKKRSIFRRALKGLSNKDTKDLGRIEDMLMQLLTEVDTLKSQTAPIGVAAGVGGIAATHERNAAQSYDNLQPEGQYEQDHGYEPEGIAGTSTASHASQSGHLSLPQSRTGQGSRLGYERKFSDHRISTVPEAEEDEYDHVNTSAHTDPNLATHYSNPDMLMTPIMQSEPRGASVPLATPPHQTSGGTVQQQSLSQENTPRTDKGKKHGSWFPKISRWSETTTSSVTKAFRNSGRKERSSGRFEDMPSRSGSDLDRYEEQYTNTKTDPYGADKLHTGFSEPELQQMLPEDINNPQPVAPVPRFGTFTPEDPKYHVHRNSLNLQHPQPRQGQTDHFKATLESRAQDFDSPMSPRSAEWAGSATSLNRFPPGSEQRRDRHSQGAAQGGGDLGYWRSSPAEPPIPPKVPLDSGGENAVNGNGSAGGPRRPPKEPLDSPSATAATPPRANRVSKLQKQQPRLSVGGGNGNSSPLPFQSVESGYGTATLASGSPRLENRNLSGALSVPTRKPSGPRAMTPGSRGSGGGNGSGKEEEGGLKEERRRKRDTFGTVDSQESETF